MGLAPAETDAQKKTLKYKERDPEKRIAFLRELRGVIAQRGADNIVYIDESGFEPDGCRCYGWSPRGHKVHGDHSGHRRPRQSLIAARRGKDFLAPMIFSGTADTALVNRWTRHMLCQELRPGSTLIWDNAAFHNKKDLQAIARDCGHHVLFLPPYSPDLSRIEPDFANIKKRRQYAPPGTPLADIVKCYGNYSE
jgi:putative transposase